MTLVTALNADSKLEGVLRHRPELLEKYRTFYQSFWEDGLVPRRILELCRRRIAYIQGCAAELAVTDPQTILSEADEQALAQGELDVFETADRAALALAELMPNGVHLITDAQVEAASQALGHAGCVALLTALSFIDVNCRLKCVLEIDGTPGEITAAHLT